MLTITDDAMGNAFVLEPSGKLEKADFETLRARFDARIEETGRVPNLVIHAPNFPGWADFGALVGHLHFVRDHQRLVEKVALVSDSPLLDLAPHIARHFVQAELRHFPADALDAALAWIAEPAGPDAVEIMSGLPDAVIGLTANGTVTARDYARTIKPLVEERLARNDKVSLLYRTGPDFDSVTAGAVWSDLRLGLTNLTRFERVAVVSDVEWIARSTRLFAPLIPAEVQIFSDARFDEAKAWIAGAT